ncbi:MAG: hypothetical protein L3I99_05575 [Sulfurimonas sp.]|nr:hypothetical protein [Sulfurimonas sp.]
MGSFKNIIEEELKLRYHINQGSLTYQPNRIIDKHILYKLSRGHDIIDNPIRDSYVISEWFSNKYCVRQLPFKYMLQTLNITDKKLKDLVLKVKRKKLNLVFVGFGGTSVNTEYWLGKILDHTGDVYLFDHVSVFDNDKIEFSNLIRFPNDFSSSLATYKAKLYTNKNSLGQKYNRLISRLSIFKNTGEDSSLPYPLSYQKTTKGGYVLDADKNTIFYGAPDLQTRKDFTETHLKLVAATHGDATCSITLNPTIDENIQTEGYGTICLNTFFWNQLAMTIGFLEFLAEDNTMSTASEDIGEEISKWDQKGRIFEFSFNDFVNKGLNGKTYRKLSFNLTHDLTRINNV